MDEIMGIRKPLGTNVDSCDTLGEISETTGDTPVN